MATKTVLVCDFGPEGCSKEATSYRLFRDGDRQAWRVDLCEDHARPLLEAAKRGELVDLPTKPRVRMEATRLRTTPKTAHLKTKE